MCLYSHIINISKLIALVDRIFYGFLFPSWNHQLKLECHLQMRYYIM